MSKSYAQYGEDLEIIRFFGKSHSGYYVDVGANNGLRDSNTALLEELGWKGLLIEANPELIGAAAKARSQSIIVHCAVVDPENIGEIEFYQVTGKSENLDGLSSTKKDSKFLEKVSTYGGKIKAVRVVATTLDLIFEQYKIPANFELLSLDVEGAELSALKGLSLDRYKPRLILVEDNSNGADWQIARYLKAWDYQRVHRTGVNDWYVRSKDKKFFGKKRLALRYQYLKWFIKYKILRKKS
ncbi:FkbM family methyltransferase [Oscillatoria sp. FACHB-1406]|uniref:FkbM family methyltransferase n=1 Tax=Oscillatoria sp. FACHB-1406 TaxID=2692846 RepID=UPI0016843069|nr:FkbM family methyltransferase [Oscillatoria sp. FACHB-1406]MBD2578963.1 FkbM family methyltransferase [Oscillatoria sp. FACHB-1406]